MAVIPNKMKRVLPSALAALSGGLLTLGLGLQSLQAGRFSTSLYWFALVVIVGLIGGLGLSLVRNSRLRWGLTGLIFIASLTMSMVSQAPVAGALQGDCATMTIAGKSVGAQPGPGQLGSADRPIQLALDSGDITATLETEVGYHGVYFGAEPVRPIDGPRFNIAGDALKIDPETMTATGTIRVADSGSGLKLIVEDNEYPAPAGVVRLAGSFVDESLADLCKFAIHVQLVAPAFKAPTGQVGMAMAAVGFVGLAASAASATPRTNPQPRPSDQPHEPVNRGGFVPDPRYAVVAVGSPDDDPNHKVVKVAIAVEGTQAEGFRADAINDLYLSVTPSPFRTETLTDPGAEAGGYKWLHVVAQHRERAAAQELAVPRDPDQDSEWIRFSVQADSDEVDVLAVLWDRESRRVWEAVRITGKATQTGNRPPRVRSVERQRQAEQFDENGQVIAAPPTLAIVRSDLNNLYFGADRSSMVRPHRSDATERLGIDLADTLNALQAAHAEPIADWTDPVVVDTFASLAEMGASLYRNLDLHRIDHDAQVVRVHDISEMHHLPLEFVYDAPVPNEPRLRPECFENLDIVRHIEDLAELDGRVCDCDPGPPTGIICPARFWGVSKVIDHFVVNGIDIERSPLATPGRWLPQPHDTLVGATDRASSEAILDLRTRLATGPPVIDVRAVNSWDEWRTEVVRTEFDVLLALPHQDKGKMSLELGGDELAYGEDLGRYLNPDQQLIILLGCATVGALNDGFRSFSSQFLGQGASVVIGSLATLNTKYSPGVAARIVAELRVAAAEGSDFGHAMRRVRRGLLEAGYPIGLAVVSLGDAAWRFEPTSDRRSGPTAETPATTLTSTAATPPVYRP